MWYDTVRKIHISDKVLLFNRVLRHVSMILCAGIILFSQSFAVASESMSIEQRLELHRAMQVQSDLVPNWPGGPVVGAESAILIEAESGTILYAKNIHQKQYPASTTKILTTLIATEQCALDEMVSFSHDAVFDTPRDSNHIAIDEGEAITMEQCLNAILIRSANEVSFAVAEHIVDGSWHDFAEIMNKRAAELGCVDSNFVNPNGLPDENHYTSAYDLAMIGRAFFANEMLCQITLTRRLEILPSDTQPDYIIENNSMQIIPGGQYAYPYLVGCKTGYTNTARSCLVSCAERDGMKLICVVLHDEAPYQYEDTISLFEYGFSNFSKVNVSQAETKYDIDNIGLFYGGNDLFGSSEPILSLNKNDCVILPRTVSLDQVDSSISYDAANENQAAVITYTYHGVNVGTVRINFYANHTSSYRFDTFPDENPEGSGSEDTPPVIYINMIRVLVGMAAAAVVVFIAALIKLLLKNYQFTNLNNRQIRRRNKRRSRKKGKGFSSFKDFDF